MTARHLGDCDDRIVPLLYECAVEPYLLGMTETLIHLGYLAELLEEFGWDRSQLLVCNLAAKMLGRNRPAPQEARREAIDLFAEVEPVIAQYTSGLGDFDSELLAVGLVSGDIEETFGAVTRVLKAGSRYRAGGLHHGAIGSRPHGPDAGEYESRLVRLEPRNDPSRVRAHGSALRR